MLQESEFNEEKTTQILEVNHHKFTLVENNHIVETREEVEIRLNDVVVNDESERFADT